MGRNICFHYFISLERVRHPEKWSLSLINFFRKCECIRSWFLPISSNLLKRSFRKTSLFVFTVIGFTEKMFCYLHISNYYFNSCNKNPRKISVKKFSFRKKNLNTLCKCIYLGARLHDTRSELKLIWNLKPLWNVVPFTWQFTWRFQCSNFPNNSKALLHMCKWYL